MEDINTKSDLDKNQKQSLTTEEKEMKILLAFAYLKSEIENNISDPKQKNSKNILKYLKQFEAELEENIDSKVTTKEKKIYIELKNSKFDDDFIKISKYI